MRNLYRTNQLTVDMKATNISILQGLLVELPRNNKKTTYSVVAFMVTVRLVENRVNRNVGIVIVVKVITQ